MQPILKWAGGKRWLAPKIKDIYSNFKDFRLVEPFCGGLDLSKLDLITVNETISIGGYGPYF